MRMPTEMLLCTLFALATTTTGQQTQRPISTILQNDPKFDVRVSELLARNVLQFAQQIGTTVLQDSDRRTEVFSPLSIYTAMSMLLMGSNGQTYQELLNLLKLNDDSYLMRNAWKIHEEFGLMIGDINRDLPNPHHRRPQDYWQTHRTPISSSPFRRTATRKDSRSFQRIAIANGIFVQNGFTIRPDYRDAMESTYKSTIQKLDFVKNAELSTIYINNWVNEKTEGKIKELFSAPLNPNTRVIIASALYFKALWEKSFMDGATRPKPFYPDGIDGAPITVNMMAHGGAFPFYDSKEHDCRIIGIPYRRNLTTMFVILPNNSNRTRLRQLQATLTADKIQNMISQMEWKTAVMLFPKLHITNELNLKAVLNRLGLRTLFQNDQSDLSLISTGAEVLQNANFNANRQQNGDQSPLFQYNVPISRYPDTLDDKDDERFIFSRFSDCETVKQSTSLTNSTETDKADDSSSKFANQNVSSKRPKRSAVTYKASSDSFHPVREPLRLKDLVIGKRITKSYPRKKNVSRGRRQAPTSWQPDSSESLKRLDSLRAQYGVNRLSNPGLFVDGIIHRVDLTINEVGTEGGAATATSLFRTGTDVVFRVETPFLFLIRHDDTKLPLFYGAVFEPTSD